MLGNLVKNTYDGYEKHLTVVERLERMENMKGMIDKVDQERREFKQKRNEAK